MTPGNAKQLGFWIQKIDVGAQKKNSLLLKTIKMVIAGF